MVVLLLLKNFLAQVNISDKVGFEIYFQAFVKLKIHNRNQIESIFNVRDFIKLCKQILQTKFYRKISKYIINKLIITYMKGIKDRKLQTTTFKHLAFPEYELFENEQQKQFAQTYTKQSTIDKVNAFQFQNNNDNCRALVDCLLKEYDLWHPETQTTLCDSLSQTENQPKTNNDIRENCIDGIMEYQNQHHINQTQSSNIKLKSHIIFLELQNKKLHLKQKLLQKKYQKQALQVKMVPSMEMILRKRQKQLLETQLNLLKELKDLSQKLQDLKRPQSSSLITNIKSNISEPNSYQTKITHNQKKKKLNKPKLLKYLLQKTQTIHSKDQFLQLLDKTQASLQKLSIHPEFKLSTTN